MNGVVEIKLLAPSFPQRKVEYPVPRIVGTFDNHNDFFTVVGPEHAHHRFSKSIGNNALSVRCKTISCLFEDSRVRQIA